MSVPARRILKTCWAMRVEIDMTERYARVAPFFERYPKAADAVAETVDALPVTLEGMTVKELCEAIDGRVPESLATKYAMATVGEWCAMRKGLVEAVGRFAGYLKRTTPPQTAEQKRLRNGLLEVTAEEAVLLTCKDFYGLHGLEEAQRLTVYEYMIARKAVYNEALQAYNAAMAARAAAGRRG